MLSRVFVTVLRSLVAILAFIGLSSSALAQNNCVIPRRDLFFSLLPVLVVYDEDARMVIAFERELHDEDLTLVLDAVDEPFPFRMTDRETGTLWSLTGMAAGRSLE